MTKKTVAHETNALPLQEAIKQVPIEKQDIIKLVILGNGGGKSFEAGKIPKKILKMDCTGIQRKCEKGKESYLFIMKG